MDFYDLGKIFHFQKSAANENDVCTFINPVIVNSYFIIYTYAGNNKFLYIPIHNNKKAEK